MIGKNDRKNGRKSMASTTGKEKAMGNEMKMSEGKNIVKAGMKPGAADSVTAANTATADIEKTMSRPNNSKKMYVAYGSNMSVEQMAVRCPDAEVFVTGVLEGWKLVFRGCATIERAEDSCVPVLVWEIAASDERNLDHYEGFPHFYYKDVVSVRMDPGEDDTDNLAEGGHTGNADTDKEYGEAEPEYIDAMVYIMGDGRPVSPPGRYYYKGIEQAYRMFGLDRGPLEAALEESRKDASNRGWGW